MSEDDVEIIIDASLGGDATASLDAMAQAAADAKAAIDATQASLYQLGQAAVQQASQQQALIRDNQTAAQNAAMDQAALGYVDFQDQGPDGKGTGGSSSGGGGGGHGGWRQQLHGMRLLAGGSPTMSKALMGGMGLMGTFGTAGVLGGGMEVTTAALTGLSSTMDLMGNSFMSAEDRARSLTESLPVVGGFFKTLNDFADSMSGAADKLRQSQYNFDMGQAAFTADATLRQKVNPLETEQAQTQAMADATRNILPSYGEAPSFLNTADYANWEANNALEDKRVATARDTAAKQAALAAVQSQQIGIVDALDVAEAQGMGARQKRDAAVAAQQDAVAKAAAQPPRGFFGSAYDMFNPLGTVNQAVIGGGTAKVAKQQIALDLDASTSNTAALQLEMEKNITEQKTLQQGLDKNAEADRQTAIDQLNQQLKIIESQVNKAKSQYESIGGMDEASKQNALLAAQQAKELGVQSLSQEQKGLIGGVAGGGDFLKELQRNYADSPDQQATTDALRAALATSGAIDQAGSSQGLDDLLAQQAAAKAAVQDATQKKAEADTGDAAGTVQAFAAQLIQAIVAATAAVKKHTEDKAFEKQQGGKP